jgi:hypothetical protein
MIANDKLVRAEDSRSWSILNRCLYFAWRKSGKPRKSLSQVRQPQTPNMKQAVHCDAVDFVVFKTAVSSTEVV